MITTSTSLLSHTEKKEEKQEFQFPVVDNPSEEALNFILSYSKNLQVKKSRFVNEIELIKS